MKRYITLILVLFLLRIPVNATGQEKLVTLTFDDGPSGRFTARLLEGFPRNLLPLRLSDGAISQAYTTDLRNGT